MAAWRAILPAIAAPVLAGTPINFTAAKAVPFSGPVATFTSANPANTVVDFTATIDQGDATITEGTITAGAGNFAVNGTPTYAMTGPFTATVTINDANPVATVTVTDSVTVSPIASMRPIPTMNAWALGALAVLLGAFGMGFVPRRNRNFR